MDNGPASPAPSAARTAPAVPHRELSVRSADGTRLHVEVHGPHDAPSIVLSHGWTCSIPFWAPVVTRLGAAYRVVLYDQRGHGRSARPARHGYGVSALADDLCAVLRATVPQGTRAVLGGHSMGGMTLMAAAQRPEVRERAAAVALISTGCADLLASARVVPGAALFPRLGAAGHRLLLGAPVPLGPKTPLTRAALHYVTMAPDARPQMVDFCARLVHACPSLPRAHWGRVLAELDLEREVRALECPATVVAGGRDRLTPIAHAHRIAAALPDCEDLVEIPRAGHMTPLEDPATVATVLSGLADRHLAVARKKKEKDELTRQRA
ncbi:alpha/beta hydrolase [Nocardiopsis rhodophaea]|uniref:alpha/beta fold hydrolase n=1 Tax=Nocardiopsis rhodophaea TaxID=280238 RepID=UPI0031D0E49D